MSFRIKDTVWIQQSFLLPENALTDDDLRRRVLTNAAFKFTDTTIGGNFAINAPPQFTRFADPRVGGSAAFQNGGVGGPDRGGIRYMLSSGRFLSHGDNPNSRYTTPSAGMGRYYSESLDDWGQDLVMRFGVPEYNSLTTFFGNFYNVDASLMARTGRTSNLFSTGGRAIGFLLALPFQPIIFGGQLVRFLANMPASKYYYLKPTMYPYWQAVNTIVNGIAVNLGIMPMALTEAQQEVMGAEDYGNQVETLNEYAKILPDVFLNGSTGGGRNGPVGLDVFAIANRAQRIANSFNTELVNKIDNLDGASQLNQAMRELQQKLFVEGGLSKVAKIKSGGIDEYRRQYLSSDRNQAEASSRINLDGTADPTDGGRIEMAEGGAGSGQPTQIDSEFVGDRSQYNFMGRLKSMFEAERRDGAQFVTFRVNYSGTAGESFSNSVEDSQISGKINSTSSAARSARFDFADGKVFDSTIVNGVINAGKQVVSGMLEGVHMSGLLALAGNAFVDIPKTWSGSTANLPRAEYTIKLRSPYGTRMSRLMNLYIPLAMLMAGALPLSTGKRSYTSPFICEAFCRGRHAIRLGMIDSMSITRGTSNLGWTQQGEPNGIDVTFSIVDMTSIMHLPIEANFGLIDRALQGAGDLVGGQMGQGLAAYAQKSTYDDDNAFTDYLAVLGSLSWQDMIYANRRWRLARYRQMQNWNSWKSPSRVASWMGHTQLGRWINAVSLETDRPD